MRMIAVLFCVIFGHINASSPVIAATKSNMIFLFADDQRVATMRGEWECAYSDAESGSTGGEWV